MIKQNEQIRSVRRLAYTTSAFTLVELIVVITILAILWTIAFISLQWYSSQARDSKRLSDIQNIKKSLELFSLNTWKYPEPDSKLTVSYGDQDLRYQWTVWEQVTVNLSRNLNEKPTDPLTENEYTYSRTYAWNEYELLSIYESDLISVSTPSLRLKGRLGWVNESYAANSNYPKINGNYNGVYVKAGTYYIPTPSIINANVWWNVDLVVTSNFLESQIITWWSNNIANVWIEVSTWWLTWMSVEVFTWIIDTDIWEDDYNNKEELAQALIDAYSWTSLANAWVYKEIVETASEDYISLVDNFVLNKDNFVNTTTTNSILPNPYVNCTGQNTPTPFSATTKYPWCDIADIIVCSWAEAWYTISACNVWATTAWTDWTNANTIWKHFQWWRNDWFAYNWWVTPTTTSTLYTWTAHVEWWIDLSWNSTYANKFIIASDTYWYNWLSKTWESTDPSWWQWPCATWYHVPSQSEWSGIVTAWQWWWNWANMQTALKLPCAGQRYWSNGSFYDGASDGRYWSSSPVGYYGYSLRFSSTNITSNYKERRALGYSVRCFKN